MPSTQIVRIHQKNLDALAAHYVDARLDDAEYIQIVRVLVSAATSLLLEDGESDTTIAQIEPTLLEHAKCGRLG
jgi:hypothetical protein